MIPVEVAAGFSRSRGFWAGRIMAATQSHWCHAMIRFRFEDGSYRLFESRIQTRGFAETDPALYDLEALAEAGLETDVEAVRFVPIADSDSAHPVSLQEALTRCEQWCGASPYPIWQLAAIWMSHRYGLSVPVSEGKLICSEAVAVIASILGVDLRDRWHPNFDAVTPGSAWNNLMAIRAGYGACIVRDRKEIGTCDWKRFSKYYSL